MRIVFMGTPEFARTILERLIADGHALCGVFTQPDKPRNRGRVTPSPVKECAIEHGIPVFQPVKMRGGTALADLQALQPELVVVAAYGRILPKEMLDVPPLGCINVHASLLPKYRGAAPINWAILNGEPVTGVTIMYMAAELDAGDIIRIAETPVDPDEDAQTLTARLALLGAEALTHAVAGLENGTAVRTPQDHTKQTYAPMLDKTMSPLDFTKPARRLHNQVRGLIPWPCATTDLNGATVKVYRTTVGEDTAAAPGSIVEAGKKGIAIACGDGKLLRILELQPQGGKRMSAAAYLAGHPIPVCL